MSTQGHESEAIDVQGLKASLQKLKTNHVDGKADKSTTLAGYGISDAYTKSETYTKTEVNGLVDTPHQEYVTADAYASLPTTGSKDTIYRVSSYNGSTSQVDASVYSEYAWNGSQYVFLCVKSQVGEVFDITVYNNNTKYADLTAALGTGGANIPESLRKGGMSVRFVQSSDNKYVQFRYMSSSTAVADFTNTDNWQGVDEEPTAGSENLVESGGVVNYVAFGNLLNSKKIIKDGSTVVNSNLDITVEQGKYYKFEVRSTENKISKVKVVILDGNNTQSVEIDNNGFVVVQSKYTTSYVYVQNTETITGTDEVSVSAYECNNSSDSVRIVKNTANIENNRIEAFKEEAVFGDVLYENIFVKDNSTEINATISKNMYVNKTYIFRVESLDGGVSNAKFVYKKTNNQYVTIEVGIGTFAIISLANDIAAFNILNTETISGTDRILCLLYEVSPNTLLYETKNELGWHLYHNVLTKSGSTVVNQSVPYSIFQNTSYLFTVKSSDKKVKYVIISIPLGGDTYQTKEIDIVDGYGSAIIIPQINVSYFKIQNIETIDGTDSITVDYYLINDSLIYKEIGCLQNQSKSYNFNESLISESNFSKKNATVLNKKHTYSFVRGNIYKFYVKNARLISNIQLAFPASGGGYKTYPIEITNNYGIAVVICEEDYSYVYIQNTETISGTDTFELNIFQEGNGIDKRIELYRASLEKEVVGVKNIFRTDIGDYTAYNILHVGVGYDYANPMDAIVSITDASETNRYLVMLHDDVELTQVSDLRNSVGDHCSNEIIETTTSNWAYIFTKNYVDIIGANREVQIKLNLPLIANRQKGYLHCIYSSGSTRIANLKLDVYNSRYCIHLENGSGSMSGRNASASVMYKNMNMINRNDVSYGYNPCIGIGTAPNCDVLIENCNCISLNGAAINSVHSHSNYAYPFRYKIKNCRFASKDNAFNEVYYMDYFSGVKSSFVIEGCDFPSWGVKRGSYDFALSLTDKAHDYRNGGAYISGHGNNFVMVRETAPCLVFETSNNNSVISAVQSDIVGSCLLSYDGTSDAHGIFVGTELILSGNGNNVLKLGSRLGDCSTSNKTLVITLDGIEQTVVFDKDYTSMSDAAILSEINEGLTGCSCYVGYDVEIPSFDDEVCYAKNSGTSTVNIGDLLTLDTASGYNCYRCCMDGDEVDAVATRRMNPNDFACVITKGHQKFRNIGGQSSFVTGSMYGADNNGGIKVVTDNSMAAFKCIGQNVLVWI